VDLAALDPGAVLELLPPREGPLSRPIRVLLDAGHGAPGNEGNTSTFGVLEQDFTLDLALDVAGDLEASGDFEVTYSRGPGEATTYAARLERARASNADVFVSLHSDVRGTLSEWSPVPGVALRASSDAPGFSVLHADEGDPALATRRRRLAVAVATELRAAGFFPYGGAEYVGLYAGDASEPGVFVDRHADDKRIFVLRRTPMPAVIVETHNALDPREAARWDETYTREVFARALGRGIAAAVAPEERDRATYSRPDVR
jgi:N-acetylmuramoyl-L-alanine amidase